MAEHFLHLFPDDPLHKPEPEVIATALTEGRRLFPQTSRIRREVNVMNDTLPSFIDCGAAFETVRCQACDHDLHDWWMGAMNRWWNAKRIDLAVKLPCCGLETDLNALAYDWPQGFTCFRITIRNPNRRDMEVERGWLSEVVGKPLRMVRGWW